MVTCTLPFVWLVRKYHTDTNIGSALRCCQREPGNNTLAGLVVDLSQHDYLREGLRVISSCASCRRRESSCDVDAWREVGISPL